MNKTSTSIIKFFKRCIFFLRNNDEKIISFIRENSVIFALVFIYVSIHDYWEIFISKHVVDVFLNDHFYSNWLNDTFFYLAVIACVILFIINWRKHYKKRTIILSLIAILFWIYYRFISHRFGFISLYSIHYIKYIDIISLYAISILLSALLKKLIPNNISFLYNGFVKDVPIDAFNEIEPLGRTELAKETLDRLLNTNTSNGSYTFGINAPWGAGKTSFMNIMKKELIVSYSYCDTITIDFNPWLFSTEKNLVTAFMDELSKYLIRYDQSLAKNLIDYAKLLSAYDTKETKFVASMINMTNQESSLETKKEQIREAIKRIKKQIFVFIDDLDRLDADELMEIMKLIRNISDFPYMYFVAAYDKTYLVKCLENKTKTNGSLFIEKIFQHEFHLPIVPIQILKKILYNSIRKYPRFSNTEMLQFIIKNDSPDNPLNTLSSIREAKRLANNVTSSYEHLESYNIDGIDLLFFELFKAKYPLVVAFFERNINEILVLDTDQQHYRLYNGKDNRKYFNFFNYIEMHKQEFDIDDINLRSIKSILDRLFEPIKEKEYQRHQRFSDKKWIDRFIHLTELETDITDTEFENVIKNKDFNIIQQSIVNWSYKFDHALRQHLLNYSSKDILEQKNLIRSLFYYHVYSGCALPDPKHIDNAILKLKHLNKEKQEFSEEDTCFIKKTLTENGYDLSICFYIAHIHENNKHIGIPLGEQDLIDIQKILFDSSITQYEKDISDEVLTCFCALFGSSHKTPEYPLDQYEKSLIESMRKFSEEHISFIPSLIICSDFGKYKLHESTKVIWGTWNNFYHYIDGLTDTDDDIIKFKTFITKFKNNGYKEISISLDQL